MKQGELVFQELIARRDAIHSLLVNSERLAVQLRGLATDNQAQIGDALKQLHTALAFLCGREKQIDTTLTNRGRGFNHAPQSDTARSGSAYRASTYDATTGEVDTGDGESLVLGAGGGPRTVFGDDGWTWMLTGPVTADD
jgi:ABC-type transporter Mla subunit MlaD